MSFVKERERRANAGNRMRALLDQEVEMEDLFELDENEEEDEEFPVEEVEEEEDKVDSDFDLDSSEGEQEQIDEGKALDKEIEKEERRARRAVTMKNAVPVPRQIKPSAEAPKKKRKLKQAVAMTDEERQPRYSSRKNTVLSRILLEGQLKEQQKKKDQQPKKERPIVNKLTQEELLAEAAITEEKNKSSLLEWQQKEAERKESAKVKDKKGLSGTFVRYHSFIESRPDFSKIKNCASGEKEQMHTSGSNEAIQQSDVAVTSSASATEEAGETNDEVKTPKEDLPLEYMARNLITFVEEEYANSSMYNMALAPSEELVESLDSPRFGNGKDKESISADLISQLHNWLTRAPKPNKPILCPITGRIAKYRDPHTNIPYANIRAYNIIRDCLQQKMNWSSTSGLFLGNIPSAKGAPDGWL